MVGVVTMYLIYYCERFMIHFLVTIEIIIKNKKRVRANPLQMVQSPEHAFLSARAHGASGEILPICWKVVQSAEPVS